MTEKKLADDYCNYFLQNDVSRELKPISLTIEEMITRLEEFESLLQIVSLDTNTALNETFPKILNFKKDFDALCNRIDVLENFIKTVYGNLLQLENQIQIADYELDIPEKPVEILIRSLNLFAKTTNIGTNLKDGNYNPPKLFSTAECFSSKNKDK